MEQWEGFSRTHWPSAHLAPLSCSRPPCAFPSHLIPAQAIPSCQQDNRKPQHKKHLVALTRHVCTGLPLCSCSWLGQTPAAAAEHSRASSQSPVITRIPARARLHGQQASCEQHARQRAGRGTGRQTRYKSSSDGRSCNVFPTKVIFKLFIKGLLLLAAGWWAIFRRLLHLSTEMVWHRLIPSFAWHPQTSHGLRGLPR